MPTEDLRAAQRTQQPSALGRDTSGFRGPKQVLPDRDSQAWKEEEEEVGGGREVMETPDSQAAHSLTA